MKHLFNERIHIENLLNSRFNFFIVIFASIIASILAVKTESQLLVILFIGFILEFLFSLVIMRTQRKLDILVKKLYSNDNEAASYANIKANKSRYINPFRFSMRKIIGYIIPAIITVCLFISILKHNWVFNKIVYKDSESHKIEILDKRIEILEQEINKLKSIEKRDTIQTK